MNRWRWLGLVLLPSWLGAAGPAADRLVLLANAREPESVALAGFYAAQRHVPAANIIALPLPVAETITWREFIDEIYQPLQDELYRRGWIEGTVTELRDRFGRRRCAFTGHQLSYLVTCRGVPLRIANDAAFGSTPAHFNAPFDRTESAVDSELGLLAWSGYDLAGPLANPLFELDGPLTLDAAQVVKVSRLDGPTWDSARHLVTAALAAENSGLAGRYYVDLGGPHPEGDEWLRRTQRELAGRGFAGETETTPATFGAEAPFDSALFYFGWYSSQANGPFTRPGFTFQPGAVAEHIYSFSADTLRAESSWCGALVARGVTATVGNVFEPDLKFVHRPDLLVRALVRGRNFGDAACYALPALSWQAIAIGDPLYCPFKPAATDAKKPADEPPAK